MSGREELFGAFGERTDDRLDALMGEHQSMRQSADALDETLEFGMAASERLLVQRAVIGRSSPQLETMIGRMPGIRGLAGTVEVKRKRDRLLQCRQRNRRRARVFLCDILNQPVPSVIFQGNGNSSVRIKCIIRELTNWRRWPRCQLPVYCSLRS
jgi:hypothetical protein